MREIKTIEMKIAIIMMIMRVMVMMQTKQEKKKNSNRIHCNNENLIVVVVVWNTVLKIAGIHSDPELNHNTNKLQRKCK